MNNGPDPDRVDRGELFVVATPIGNLEDMTLRAIRVLKEVDVIAAEDTRVTAHLLARYAIAQRPMALHAHNERGRTEQVLQLLAANKRVALVSDAGTPGISDPGAILVEAVRAAGFRVTPVPGPSALAAALSVSGIAAERILFCGFLPAKASARRNAITELGNRITRIVEFEKQEASINTIVDHGLGNGGSAVDLGTLGGDEPGMAMKVDEAWNVMINAWSKTSNRYKRGKEFRNKVVQAKKVLRNADPRRNEMRIPLDNQYNNLRRQIMRNAAMSVATTTAGGYTIPSGFVYALEEALLYFGPIMQIADVMRTATGQPLPWPTVNDTGNSGVMLSENTTVGSSVAPTFGQVLFNAFKFSSQLIQISAELLEDSAFDLANYLGTASGTRLGRIINTKCTVGSGSGEPQGIVTGASLGVTCASATAIAFDEVINLEYAVPLAYRPRMAYMTADTSVNALRKIKDSYGRYLWQETTNSGAPDKLNNRPYHTNPDMASIATGNKTMLAGDFSKYKVRMINQVRSRRLLERYADADQEAFISFLRLDAKVLDAGTRPIVYMVQP